VSELSDEIGLVWTEMCHDAMQSGSLATLSCSKVAKLKKTLYCEAANLSCTSIRRLNPMVQVVTHSKACLHNATKRVAFSHLLAGAPQKADAIENALVFSRHPLTEEHSPKPRLQSWNPGQWQQLAFNIP
jgi:hypothetical protein